MITTRKNPEACENCESMIREAQERCNADARLATTITVVCAECQSRYEHDLSAGGSTNESFSVLAPAIGRLTGEWE